METKSQDSHADKRFAPRRSRRLPAMCYVEGAPNGVRGMITDISTTGARVQLDCLVEALLRNTTGKLKRLRLVDLAERVTYECWIVREGERDLGLKFAAPPVLPAQPQRKSR